MRVAAIDVGSNSVKLAVADVEGEYVHVVQTKRITLQIGRHVETNGCLGEDVIGNVAKAAGSLATVARMAGARRIDIVGTSAAREATDGNRLQRVVSEAVGVPMRRLTGLQEAHLVSRSIELAVGMPLRSSIMLDIGGGSTELVQTDGGLVVNQVSVPLGAVRLTDRLGLRGEAAFDAQSLMHLQHAVADGFSGVFNVEAGHTAFGCGGTVTALARLHLCEAPRKDSNEATIDRSILSIETVDGLFDRLTGQSLTERVAFTGLSTERAQIIPAGAALLSGVMHQLHLDELQVHEQGIRTGLLFDVAQR